MASAPQDHQATNGTTSSSTIPYTHGAAGHQGISTSNDGSLLIKPCTQAEIDFYESAKAHPSFQAHMPVYLGSLTQAPNDLQQQAQNLQTQQAGSAPTNPFTSTSPEITTNNNTTTTPLPRQPTLTTPNPRTHQKRPSEGAILSDPKIARSANKEWTPSGGAKLSSNLSIVLSNATAGFTRPNVIDLKLGARLWDDDAPQAKRDKLDEVSRTSTSGSLGFRVAGMKVFVGLDAEVRREVNTDVEDGYKTYNKFYGRSNVDEHSIASAFEAFLYSLELMGKVERDVGDAGRAGKKVALRRRLLVERLLREISSVEYVLEREESRMYSASVLMVYEGDPDALETVLKYTEHEGDVVAVEAAERGTDGAEVDAEDGGEEDLDDEEEEEMRQNIHQVVMIDFAHAHWTSGEGPDENMLQGIRSIKQILEEILAGISKQKIQ